MPLLVGILSFKSGEGIVGVASIICFVIAMVFFALFVMADKPEFGVEVTWKAHANLFYSNWLNFVYQGTTYDIDEIANL